MGNEEDCYKEKDVAFYSATVNAWYTTKFEKDKHLLSLSTAGVGLLVTLATTVGALTLCTAAMYFLAVFSFLVCILTVLSIFSRNADHLQRLIKEDEDEDKDPFLDLLDKSASTSFVFGIIFTLLVGLFSGIQNFKGQEVGMEKDLKNTVTTSTEREERSVNGAGGMRPSKPNSQSTSSGQNNQSTDSESDKK